MDRESQKLPSKTYFTLPRIFLISEASVCNLLLYEDIAWARELLKQKKSIVQIASTDSEGRCLKWQGLLKENGKFSYCNIANGTDVLP